MKHATLQDVAKRAGVAVTTVSTVLNGHADRIGISTKTRERVQLAAERLRYVPSAAGRALKQRRTRTLGLLVADTFENGFLDPNFADTLSAVDAACERRGYGLRVAKYNLTNLASFALPMQVSSHGVDAVILAFAVETAIAMRFREFGVPAVLLGCEIETPGVMPCIFSRRERMRVLLEAVAYAASLGHRRIGHFIGGELPFVDETTKLTTAARLDARTEHCRIESANTGTSGQTFEAGTKLAQRWLATPAHERPTCVMACEHTLIAFLSALNDRGLSCPRDVSVISLDDSHLCAYVQPRLTAISWNLPAAATQAVDLLADSLDNSQPIAEVTGPSHQLIIRGSCAAPPLSSHTAPASPRGTGEIR